MMPRRSTHHYEISNPLQYNQWPFGALCAWVVSVRHFRSHWTDFQPHTYRLIGKVWGIAFGLFVVAIILYGLWDLGIRTFRVEEGQRRLMRDIEKVRNEHHAA
jgi:hypothetical protein